jgi:hypothetical protein
MSAYTCPAAPAPYYPPGVSVALTVAFPVLVGGMVGGFCWFRSQSVLLRRRALEPLLVVCLGCAALWISVPLRDSLGPENFPCVLAGVFDFLAPPLIMAPLAIRLVNVDSQRAEQELQAKNVGIRESQVQDTANLDTFGAYVKKTFLRQRGEDVEYKSLVFATSKAHLVIWLAVACLPFVIGFLASLALLPAWQATCNGCELVQGGAVFLLLATTGIFVVGLQKAHTMRKHPDPLHHIAEFVAAFSVYWFFVCVALVLHIVDPGQVSRQARAFDWRWISLLGTVCLVFVITLYQVLMARGGQSAVLANRAFDDADRLLDLKSNKELFALFAAHMKKEMCDEAIKFVLDVDAWKDEFRRKTEGRQRAARIVYDTYIVRKARLEINIPSKMRDALTRDFNMGNVPMDAFDPAYKEAVHLLMTDSFPRFLASAQYHEFAAKAGHVESSSRHSSVLRQDLVPRALSSKVQGEA